MSPSKSHFYPKIDDETKRRHIQIIELVNAGKVKSQLSLAKKIHASQATISRDFDYLGIERDPNRGFYALTPQTLKEEQRKRLQRVVTEEVKQVYAQPAVFALKTSPGHARSVAVTVEETYKDDIFGTITSEDTTLIITKDEDTAKRITKELCEILEN